MSAISFCACETTTAMSVVSMKSICDSIHGRSSTGASASRILQLAEVARPTLAALGRYIRTAVTLSMATYIALPLNPRPTKWATRSAATVSSRSLPGDQLVLAGKAPRRAPAPAFSSSSASSRISFSSSLKSIVDDLELGNPVLVEQRDRRAVLDRVAEV